MLYWLRQSIKQNRNCCITLQQLVIINIIKLSYVILVELERAKTWFGIYIEIVTAFRCPFLARLHPC